MFEFLENFRIVLVTGPQRSGTRICSRMIAADTAFQYVDENAFHVHDVHEFTQILKGKRLVVQCPALCYRIQQHSGKDTAIVLMLRDVADIIASQERINWQGEERELKKYKRQFGVISEVKYTHWFLHQRRKIHNPYEIEYRKLNSHPLWVDPEKRAEFGAAQWKI